MWLQKKNPKLYWKCRKRCYFDSTEERKWVCAVTLCRPCGSVAYIPPSLALCLLRCCFPGLLTSSAPVPQDTAVVVLGYRGWGEGDVEHQGEQWLVALQKQNLWMVFTSEPCMRSSLTRQREQRGKLVSRCIHYSLSSHPPPHTHIPTRTTSLTSPPPPKHGAPLHEWGIVMRLRHGSECFHFHLIRRRGC